MKHCISILILFFIVLILLPSCNFNRQPADTQKTSNDITDGNTEKTDVLSAYEDLLCNPAKGLASLSEEELKTRIKTLEDAIDDVTKHGKENKERQIAMLLSLQLAKIETMDALSSNFGSEDNTEQKRFWAMQKLHDYYATKCELQGTELSEKQLEKITAQLDAVVLRKDVSGDLYSLYETGGFVSKYYLTVSELTLYDFFWYYPPTKQISDPADILSFIRENTTLDATEESIVSPLSLIGTHMVNETLVTHAQLSADDLEPDWRHRYGTTSDGEYLLSWASDAGPHAFCVDRGYIDEDSGMIYLFGSKNAADLAATNEKADFNDLLIGCFVNGEQDFVFISLLPSQARSYN